MAFPNYMDEYESNRWTLTENDAPALSTTGNALLDLFGVIGSLRTRPNDVIDLFEAAFNQDPVMAVRMSCYARDVRGGLKERLVPRLIWQWLGLHDPDAALAVMPFIPVYGRWDDLYTFIGTLVEDEMWNMLSEQFYIDLENCEAGKSVTLLGKWLKSANASSKETKHLGKLTASNFSLSEKSYRKCLKMLRDRIDIVESKMSNKRWGEIDYGRVPSRAMMIYRKAFGKHDPEGFAEYLVAVTKGEKKINSGTLFPYDIMRAAGLFEQYDDFFSLANYDDVLQAQWDALPNYLRDGVNAIVMADTSSSMRTYSTMPMDTAIGLAVYFAQRNTGAYHNRFITFSRKPSWVILNDDDNLKECVGKIPAIVQNTDLKAAFQMILEVAVRHGVSRDEMPKALIVISDMEIDNHNATSGILPETFHNTMKSMYAQHGYELPTIVYWCVDSRNGTVFHADKEQPNTMLASGHSTSVFRDIINSIGTTPMEAMMMVLNSDRYACINF